MRSRRGDADIRIGLTPRDFLSWQGGRELFALIEETLAESLGEGDVLSLVGGTESHSAARRLASRVRARLSGRKITAAQAPAATPETTPYRPGAFDVIGPLISPPYGIDSPWLGYIPDVQHRRLPDLFSAHEHAERDRRFRAVLNRANLVIVNAADVANDLRHFYPEGRADIVALPFAACADPAWFDGRIDVRAKYGLEADFFICSNQFWKHKNHAVLFDAAALARERGTPIRFALTGATHDYRHPGYFEELCGRIEALGIASDIFILGFIPKDDQIQLMRAARAVVQPSLFEGSPGGGAVYNAVALGRPTIVSDLPVNREIDGLVSHYFDPLDPEELLEKLLAVQRAEPVHASQAELISRGNQRRRQFGNALRQAFARACR